MYSRATTSEMADRVFFGFDVVALGVVEGFDLGILRTVLRDVRITSELIW